MRPHHDGTRRASRAATTALAALAVASACAESDPSDAEIGTMRARMTIADTGLDVRAVRFTLTDSSSQAQSRDVALMRGGIGAADPNLRDQWFADWLLSVPADTYAVQATPLQADGTPSAHCPTATGRVTVVAGATAELSLVSNCQANPQGGLDVSLALNQPPTITGLDSPSGKFLCVDEPFTADLVADDPDGDPVTWSWTVQAPANVASTDYCLAAADGELVFSTVTPGRYEVTVDVSDGRGSTSLTFPIYVDGCGTPACPGLAVPRALSAPPTSVAGTCACTGSLPNVLVTPNAAPRVPTVSAVNGQLPRPVERYVNSAGDAVDFVADELLVSTADPVALSAFLSRYNGTVRGTIDLSALGVPQPPVYRVAIDPALADPTQLPNLLAAQVRASGSHTFSSTAGVGLFAAALQEQAADSSLTVGLNFLLDSDDFASRSTLEQPLPATPDPSYPTRDAYQWPYMNRASEQDIGTGEAWTQLDATGRLRNRVRLAVADGGFRLNPDFPMGTRLLGTEGVPNPADCGGRPCPWHGTWTAMTAAAVPDNGVGLAGPAGPVADLTLLQSPAPDVGAIFEYIASNIPTGIATRPNILNISASFNIPSEACLAVIGGVPVCEVLNGITAGFRAAGMLIFASAGNVNEDVDAVRTFDVFGFPVQYESDITLPCELAGVTCVSGLDWDTDRRDPLARFGSRFSEPGSVDIYGPYDVYVAADPVAAAGPTADLSLTIGGGTSYASPYVAGVAALVWAANPSLSADQVEQILFDTAHTQSSDPTVHRWVNALGAVLRAMGRNAPPFLRIRSPVGDFPQGVTLNLDASVEEIDGDDVTVEWRSGGRVIGRGPNTRVDTSGWAVGEHVIEAQATDALGNASAVDTTRIRLTGAAAVRRTVSLPSTGELCPQGIAAGDAEFARAPRIDIAVQLRISGDRRSIVADIDYVGQERGGSSRVNARFTRTLYTTAGTERIASIESVDRFSTSYVGLAGGAEFGGELLCNDGVVNTRTYPTGLVSRTQTIDDTGGPDISVDADCRCDSKIVDIALRPVELLITP